MVMSSAIYYRLLGQGTVLTLHAGNSITMFLAMQNEELIRDPDIKNMISMQNRYLTVWNIGFQLAYFSLAFACDFLTVTGKDNLIPKSIKKFRQTFFASLVFPVSVLIFIIFWPMFIIHREWLFPEFIDKMFSFNSNLIMHFYILLAVLWELAFLPRPVPKSHALNIAIVVSCYILYNYLVIQTYNQRGLLPYPILKLTYGTLYFPLFLLIAFFIGLGAYFSQWKLTALFWGKERKLGKDKFS